MKRNPLIIITVNALSPLDLPVYGNEKISTPGLDQLGWTGTVFHEYHTSPAGFAKTFDQLQPFCNANDISIACHSIQPKDIPSELAPAECDVTWYRIASDLDEKAMEIVLAIEELICLITHKREANSFHWIITTESGGFLDNEQCSSASFAADYQHSLTRQFWAPLIVSSAGENAEHCRNQSLMSAEDLLPVICNLLELNAGLVIQNRQEILLHSDKQLGLRTAEWLLCIPQSEKNRLEENSLHFQEPELFAKPEDRFDLNDISQSEPELTSQLMQKLHEMIKE
ncbi:hypothetical protein [Rubinisphaera italica]|uniref:Sulfatase n=1 Tax=Rubinisphaera italica TaxID=2527969 RepID=A0A5C5XLL6_9PLAN|nr:hypothetical protein [Rubinisphaera italica]TWT64106.1 hypothetical protein Pan54_48670 [Rubinisphaera italica]